jgi:hypothetical protein
VVTDEGTDSGAADDTCTAAGNSTASIAVDGAVAHTELEVELTTEGSDLRS